MQELRPLLQNLNTCIVSIATSCGNAILCTTLNMGSDGWYQWSTDNTTFTNSTTLALNTATAKTTATLYIKPTTGNPPTPQPPVINWGGWVDPTPEEEPEKVEAATTFDGGIALSVAVTVLAATGSAYLAKKRED